MGRSRPVGALLLAPGAGADRESPALVAVEDAVTVPVARMDFPYRKEGRKAPDGPPKLLAAVLEEAAALAASAHVAPRRIVLGGRSMGGRICSIAVAEGLPAAALVMMSYPLHPPGKPEKLRIEHFPEITVPCLFVGGTNDPFGSPDELEHHTASIAGPVTHVWVSGGHSPKGQDAHIATTVADWLKAL
ncbi:MAG TPA: alpha/beta family hydrolase [Iamia sp.]|nr:alpha/beta family hydrolase [Iamia sp.]